MHYDAIEPFGEIRNEIRHGQQMALTCNLNRDSKARPAPFLAADFMNYIEKPRQETKPETPAELSQRIAAALNSKG